MLENKKLNKHDFYGACVNSTYGTFSVGIFQWLAKSRGNGLKRSAVKYRVRGYMSDRELVFSEARKICRMFDEGKEPNKRSHFVNSKKENQFNLWK